MGKTDDKLFEEMLEKAFMKQYNDELTTEPSNEELDSLYPITLKQKRDAHRLSKKQSKPLWLTSLGRVAVILLCVCLTGFGAMMMDPGIRATVGDNIVKYIEQGFNIDFTEANDYRDIEINKTEIDYIPEGFELVSDRTEESADSLSYTYMNGAGEYIVIDILSSSDIELITEDEHHGLVFHNIGKYNGYISYSDTQKQGSVYFGNSYFTVAISGMTDRDELIKIAENIEIKD